MNNILFREYLILEILKMKSKKLKILYICTSIDSNKSFYKFLKKNYSVKVCQSVLPNSIQEFFGKFNFSESDKYIDINDWEFVLKYYYSIEEIIYKFGIDLKNSIYLRYHDKDKLFYFKKALKKYLEQLGFDVPVDKTISEVLSSIKRSNNFIKESDLKSFELIIIDNIINLTKEDSSILENGKIDYPHVQYKVTPEILHKLLRSNQKLLLFLNSEMKSLSTENFIHLNSMFERINLSRIELSYEIFDEEEWEPEILQGFDNATKLDSDIGEFRIKLNDSIRKKYQLLYKDVNNIHTLHPIQLAPYNKYRLKDSNKILLKGNRESTKISCGYSYEYKYVTYSKLFPYDNNNPKSHETIFGVIDTDNRNVYAMLSGSLNSPDCFDDKESNNRIFIQNAINYLLNLAASENLVDVDTLPNIVLSIEPRFLSINGVKIMLSKTEFCYYLYFLQRAKDELEFADVKKESNIEFNKDESEIEKQYNPSISSEVIKEIIEIYNKVYPGDDSNIKLKNKYFLDKTTPSIKPTLTSIVSRINNAIKKKLKNTPEEKFIEHVTITKGQTKFLYGINIPSNKITFN